METVLEFEKRGVNYTLGLMIGREPWEHDCIDRDWDRPRKYFQALTLNTFGGLQGSLEENDSHNNGTACYFEETFRTAQRPGSIYLPRGGRSFCSKNPTHVKFSLFVCF